MPPWSGLLRSDGLWGWSNSLAQVTPMVAMTNQMTGTP